MTGLLLASAWNVSVLEFATAVLIALIAFIFLAWGYYDWRASRWNDWRARFSTFSCLKCRHLYSQPRQPKTAACPKCGFENPHLKF